MTQRLQALSGRMETERAANTRGREELYVALRALVTPGGHGTAAAAVPSPAASSNPFEGQHHAAEGSDELGADINAAVGATVASSAAGVSFGDLYADILRVGGAGDTLRSSALELINHMTVQYSATALDPSERERLRSHLDAVVAAVPSGPSSALAAPSSFKSVEQLLAEVRGLFDHYRRREREAASVLLQTARDEAEARRFAEEQAAESRRELKQTQAWLEALRAQKDVAERNAAAEVSLRTSCASFSDSARLQSRSLR